LDELKAQSISVKASIVGISTDQAFPDPKSITQLGMSTIALYGQRKSKISPAPEAAKAILTKGSA
jgi:hypothetical protein